VHFRLGVQTHALTNNGLYCDDNMTIQLEFANGSQGTITYVCEWRQGVFQRGAWEIFGGGGVGVLEDFRELELSRGGRKQSERSPCDSG